MNDYDPLHGAADGPADPLLRHPGFRHLPSPRPHPLILPGDCSDGRSDADASPSSSLSSPASSFSSASSAPSLISEGFATLSRPIVVLDFVWNLAFILVSVAVLLSTIKERPSTPLRLWLAGYALQCVFHVGFICLEYRRADYDWLSPHGTHRRLIKRLESANTILSSMWWVFGFYWVVVGGQGLIQDSPCLYWLTVVFLVFDVFFVIFCIGMAFLVFCALFCCIPIVAMIYTVVLRPEGASEDVIRNLPKHRYRPASSLDGFENLNKRGSLGTYLVASNNSCSSSELVLHPDDSECCICLSSYVDGEELRSLPCKHHFHSGCIGRWLQINATCPLCKFDILRRDSLV